MTWLELEERGVTATHVGRGKFAVRGPAELGEVIRFEVASRMALVGEGIDYATRNPQPGRCSCCGDEVHYQGRGCPGHCTLCILARAKAIDAVIAREGLP